MDKLIILLPCVNKVSNHNTIQFKNPFFLIFNSKSDEKSKSYFYTVSKLKFFIINSLERILFLLNIYTSGYIKSFYFNFYIKNGSFYIY